MKETMKNVWWKIPLYSMIAGVASFFLQLTFFGRWYYEKLPDGTLSPNYTFMTVSRGILFTAVLLVGGLLFFRKMTKKELLCSATVMLLINVLTDCLGLVIPPNTILFYLSYTKTWYHFVSILLSDLGLSSWLAAFVGWACVYLFVLFGKKDAAKRE